MRATKAKGEMVMAEGADMYTKKCERARKWSGPITTTALK
jgi:hypothetical protein